MKGLGRAFLILILVSLAIAADADEVSIKNTINELSNLGSRVAGYPGCGKAAQFVHSAFEEAGLSEVRYEEFSVSVPIDKGGSLRVEGGRKVKLHSLWPNLVRTSTLPPGGLKGRLLYGGSGEFANLNGEELKDNILLLDFNCGSSWLNWPPLGIKALIFIEPENTTRIEAEEKFLQVPLNVPRFWVAGDDANYLLKKIKEGDISVRIKSRTDWEKVTARNVLGKIPGTDSELKDELIVLSAYYDSMSVVPSLSPGAEQACGITALLELVRLFGENPPKRTILFLATSAHCLGLEGINAFIQRHARSEEPFKSEITEPLDIKLFIGLDITSRTDELGIWHGWTRSTRQAEYYCTRMFAPYGKKFMNYSRELCEFDEPGHSGVVGLTNGISPIGGISWETLVPGELRVDGGVVLSAGLPSLNFVTINDGRYAVDTPLDNKVDFGNLSRQIEFLKSILTKALNDTELHPDVKMELKDRLMTLRGRIVTFDPRKSFVPNEPVMGAVALVRSQMSRKTFMGVRGERLFLTGEDGIFEDSCAPGQKGILEAYYSSPQTGEITLAPDKGVNGDMNYPMEYRVTYRFMEHMIVLFPCLSTNIYGLVDPRYLTQLDRVDVFDISNSVPFAYGYSIIGEKIRNPLRRTSSVEPYAVIFSEPGRSLKAAFGTGPLGMRLLLLNSSGYLTKDGSEGEAFTTGSGSILKTSFQSAQDMIFLNQFRMNNFEKYGVSNERLRGLHESAVASLEKAKEAGVAQKWDDYMKFSRRALGITSRSYPDVKGTANDVVRGVVFYLVILFPFAYLMERLLLGFVDIRKQILAVFVIFLIIYYIMRLVHPAFKLTDTPEVILLAFIILTLSTIVLSIISSRFEEQMRRMKKENLRQYETDIGRISASSTAFSLGISNMKRRKVRTLLTSATLTLLTFTVLSFTSVRSYLKFNQVRRPNSAPYEGVLIRDVAWGPLEGPACEYIKAEFEGEGIISPRAWCICEDISKKSFVKVRYKDKSAYALGVVGMSPQEPELTGLNKCLTCGSWFRKGEGMDFCILPQSLADLLGVKPGDVGKAEIRLFGRMLTVKGIIDGGRMGEIKDLDNSPLTPVDFSAMGEELIKRMRMERQAGSAATGKAKLMSFTHLEAGQVAIIPYELAMSSGGVIQSVAVKFKKEVNTRERIEDFVSRLAVVLFAGIDGKTSVYSSLGLTSFVGMGSLFVPVFIASLIVLNTMMGSVYERFKEIGTYSSVGLAPVHIGALFIAESVVYAVLGAVGGYLLGQVVAGILVRYDLLSGLTLNYSSLSAVTSTLVIMATVILSTIYPARKASQMAVPDVTRKWVIPEPRGDRWEFDFPFTVGGLEVLGLCTFLKDYFASCGEESIGNFYTAGAQFSTSLTGEERAYVVKMNVWLAPYDLGVSQSVVLEAAPMGEYGIYAIRLLIERSSGEVGDWKRLNRQFLNTMRKQFLVWRTVSPEVKEEYRAEGEKLIQK